ncbi:MAG: hypothetical protein GKR87_12640 [Kiritimatiellae bacterium]|nr:hypothetical protein [Kiritimatiellia bacterium]
MQIPRDHLGLFKPVFLEVLDEKRSPLDQLAFKLYSKGLTTRDIEDVFQELYAQKYSRSRISRITETFRAFND